MWEWLGVQAPVLSHSRGRSFGLGLLGHKISWKKHRYQLHYKYHKTERLRTIQQPRRVKQILKFHTENSQMSYKASSPHFIQITCLSVVSGARHFESVHFLQRCVLWPCLARLSLARAVNKRSTQVLWYARPELYWVWKLSRTVFWPQMGNIWPWLWGGCEIMRRAPPALLGATPIGTNEVNKLKNGNIVEKHQRRNDILTHL